MELPKEAIIEFKEAYEAYYRKVISIDEAKNLASIVFRSYKAIYQPVNQVLTKEG